MKKLIPLIIALALFPSIASAQNSSLWTLVSNKLKPVVSSWGLQIPSLGSSTTTCATVNSIGVFGTTTCASGSGNSWNLTGNSGTVAGTDFIGTSDLVDFVTKTNGIERIRTNTNGLTGFGTVSPTATGYFAEINESISAPVSATFSFQGGSSGYFIGQNSSYYYSIYASKLVGATRIYSASYNNSIGDAVDANFAPTNFDGSINYTGSGIPNSGQSLTYNIYAIYSSSNSPTTVGSKTVTFDNASGDGVVNLSWTAPVYGNPNVYWIEQGGNYVVVSGSNTSYQDSVGSFSSGFPGTIGLLFTIYIDTATVSGADQYTYENTTNFTYIEGAGNSIIDSNSWTGGTPTVSPTTASYPTLYSEGDTYIASLGASKLLSFYGVTGVPQQTGNLITALQNYGLVGSAFIDTANIASRGALSGTSNQVILSGSGVNALAFSSNIQLSLPQNIHTAATPQFQRMGLGVAANSTQSFSVTIGTNTHKGIVVKGAASQSGNLLEYQNSSATVLGTVDSVGRYYSPLGTTTLPTYSFTGDTDTGIFNPSSNAISFSTNATEIGRFTTTGLGIATTTPAYKLDVVGDINFSNNSTLKQSGVSRIDGNGRFISTLGSSTTPGVQFLSDSNTGMFSPTADTIAFSNGGLETLRISSVGNVGIGTTSPYALLSLKAISTTPSNILFAIASTSNSTLFSVNGAGHIVTGGSAPTVSTCGTGPSISGNDTTGTITVGTGVVVACTITFSTPRANSPRVVGVTTGGGLNITGGYSAKSTTAVTFSFAATVGGGTFDYFIIE